MLRAQASTAAAAAGLLFGAFFFGGAAGNGSIPFLGGAAVAAASLLLAWVRPGVSRLGALAGGLALALVAWTGLSILWSAQDDRSWDYLNRGLVYLAFGAVGLALGALVERRAVATGLAALLGLVAAWALLGKAIPALGPEARIARLRSPVGIWNELALLGDLALPLALWLATSRGRAARIGGALLFYGWTIAIALTVSRGGVLVAVVVVAAWLLLAGPKLESVAALLVAGVPGGVVAAIAFGLTGVTGDLAGDSVRRSDGAWFGLAVLLGAALVVGLTLASERVHVSVGRRRALGRLAAVAVSVAILGGVVVGATHASTWWDEFKNPASAEVSNKSTRFVSTSSNNRWRWWTEAWRGWKDEPVLGYGAGTFELVHKRFRDNNQGVTEPHNLPLQFLSETGLVGGALFVGLFAAAGVAGFRRERESFALWLGLPAYFLHALLDVDWDFAAVTAPVFLVAGVLVARPGRPRMRLLPGLVGAVVAAVVIYSLASPWLAERALDRASSATTPAAEAREARRAHTLNPLSIEPLRTWASAEFQRGKLADAYRLYLDEVELQPKNPDALCDVGSFELLAANDAFRAYRHLNDWYTLDRQGSPICLRLLDEARRRVNAGG